MATLETAFSIFSSKRWSSPKSLSYTNPLSCLSPRISTFTPTLSLKSPVFIHPTRKLSFQVCSSAVEEIPLQVEKEEEEEVTEEQIQQLKKKLFVFNLPWSLNVVDVKTLFGECGTVTDVEVIKQKSGKSRGFAFVTMSSGEEAQAVIDKFDSHELLGRIIRVEFAKKLKKPSPPSPMNLPLVETRHKLYVSNLAWKVRSTHLREFFSANFSPVSARVVFDSPSGRSSGYGFASFATKEEAEAAISELDGKELFGRPIRLKFSEKNVDDPENKEEGIVEGQPEES